MKKLVVFGILVLALLLAAFYFRSSFGFGAEQEETTAVRIEPVERGDLVEFVTAPGIIQAKTQVSISARFSAQVVALPFEEGERVTKGDPNADPPVPPSVLVKLDDTDLQASLRAARARRAGQAASLNVAESQITAAGSTMQSMQVQLDQANRELERQQSLFTSQDVAQKAVDDAVSMRDQLAAQLKALETGLESEELNLEVLKAQIQAADAEIDQAEDQLQYTTILSPIDGVITSLAAEVGEIVVTGTMNNAGTVIMTVADLSQMIVEAQVDETDITEVKVGQKALIRASAYGDEVLRGTVRSVALSKKDEEGASGSSGQSSRYYICEVLLNPADTEKLRVFSGLTADAQILTRENTNVVRVPSQAVVGRRVTELPPELQSVPEVRQQKEFTTVIYRVVDGVARVTPVEVGASDLQQTMIVSGLEEGAQIITGPYKVLEEVRDGQEVVNDGSPPAASGGSSDGSSDGASAAAPATVPASTRPAASRPAESTGAKPNPPAPLPRDKRTQPARFMLLLCFSSSATSAKPTASAARPSAPSTASTSTSTAANTSPSWVPAAAASQR